jgi:hypothetical protein
MVTPSTAKRTWQLVTETQRRLTDTRRRIGTNGWLTQWSWGLSSISESSNRAEALFRSVRNRLALGVFPLAPDRVWVGKGTGKTCVICARNIKPGDIENETSLRLGGVEVPVWIHFDCFNIWQRASRAVEEARCALPGGVP